MTSQVERRKLLICLFVVFIASHVFVVFVVELYRSGDQSHWCGFCTCDFLVDYGVSGDPYGSYREASTGIEFNCHRYSTGDGLRFTSRAHCGPVFRLANDLLRDWYWGAYHPLCLIKLLPLLPSEHSGSLKSLPLLFRRPALMSIYLLTVVVVTAHYTAYSYIEPFVQNIAGFSANFATALLLLLGGAGIIGSVIFGKLGNQYASALVSTAIALLLVCLALLLPAANSEIHLGVLSIFWGIAMMIIGLGMQVKVLALAPDATDVAMALFSGIFNIGIGAGALVGNQVSLHWSMSMIGYVGAVPAFAALIWSIIIFRRW